MITEDFPDKTSLEKSGASDSIVIEHFTACEVRKEIREPCQIFFLHAKGR